MKHNTAILDELKHSWKMRYPQSETLWTEGVGHSPRNITVREFQKLGTSMRVINFVWLIIFRLSLALIIIWLNYYTISIDLFWGIFLMFIPTSILIAYWVFTTPKIIWVARHLTKRKSKNEN
jgi:hypothetical protein